MIGPRIAAALFAACLAGDGDPADPAVLKAIDRHVQTLARELAAGSATAAVDLSAIERELTAVLTTLPGSAVRHASLIRYKIDSARARHDATLTAEDRQQALERAVAHADASGLAEPRARARLLLAENRMLAGQFSAAEALLDAALAEQVGASATEPFVRHAHAELDRQLGRYTEALAQLDAAAKCAPAGEAWRPLGWRIPGTRGHVYLELGLFDLAAAEFAVEQAACEPLRKLGPGSYMDVIRSQIHEVNLALGQGDDAQVLERTGRYLADDVLYPAASPWRAQMLVVRGTAAARLQREGRVLAGPAEQVLREALAVAELPERERAACEIELAEALLVAGDLVAADELLDRAADRMQRFRAERARRDELVEDVDLQAARIRLALLRGDPKSALREHVNALAAALDTRLALWALAPVRPGGLGFLQPVRRRVWLSELIRGWLASAGPVDGARQALRQLWQVQCQGTLVRARGGVDVDLEAALASLCSADGLLLVYLPGPERSHLLCVDRTGVEHFELAAEGQLEARRLRYLDALGADGPAAAADEWSGAVDLAAAVLPDGVRARLAPGRELTIVGDDLLGALPFELLPLAAGERVCERCPVAYLPSLPLGCQLAASHAALPPAAPMDLLLVAAPTVAARVRSTYPEAGALSFTVADRRRLIGAFADERVTGSRRGRRAPPRCARSTRRASALRAIDASRFRVVQFLLHAVLDFARERPAALVLAPDETDDGLFCCADIETLVAPALVLLTACRAGQGPARRGDEGLGNMGGAWLAAGATAVVLSDADVEYRVAVALSERFHAALVGDGVSPAEALRRARLGLVEDGVVQSPVAVGRLRVVGLGHRPLFAAAQGNVASPRTDAGSVVRRIAIAIAIAMTCLAVLVAIGCRRWVRRPA